MRGGGRRAIQRPPEHPREVASVSQLDQFESVFRAAVRAVYTPAPVAVQRVLVVTDLHAARAEQAFVARRITVAHAAFEHVGHGLEAAVRMVGKTGDIVARVVGAEGIEHQERVEPPLQVLGQDTDELDAGAVLGGLAGDETLDVAGCCHGWDRHGSKGSADAPANRCRGLTNRLNRSESRRAGDSRPA